MLIFEVENSNNKDPETLAAISKLLSGRAEDQAAKKQISVEAFLDIARSMGINVTEENLGEMITKPPLSNLLEPYDPTTGVVSFKGDTEVAPGMSVDQAEQVVDANAKAAMKRGMKSA